MFTLYTGERVGVNILYKVNENISKCPVFMDPNFFSFTCPETDQWECIKIQTQFE